MQAIRNLCGLGALVATLAGIGCSSSESAQSSTDAAAPGDGGNAGAASGGKGGGSANGGKGSGTGGTATTSGGAGGVANVAGAANGGAREGGALDGSPDAPASLPSEASCRGSAAPSCPSGKWHASAADGGACTACPAPVPKCADIDLAASTFTVGSASRPVSVAFRVGAEEAIDAPENRMGVIWGSTTCGGSPAITTFIPKISRESDRTVLTANLWLITSVGVPCGEIHITFRDGCCVDQEVRLQAHYEAGITTFSCVDGG